MADSRLRVATLTSLRTFTKTEQEVAQILNWFVEDKIDPRPEGISDVEENQRRLDFAHDEILRFVVREARRNRLRQLREAQGDLEQQASQETTL